MQNLTYLRNPLPDDEVHFLTAVEISRDLHHPWVYPPSTSEQYQEYIDRIQSPTHAGFFIVVKGSEKIAGVININEIVTGNFCSGYLGYYIFSGFERQGLMTMGLNAVIDTAFHTMRLHRLEANIQPDNISSIALVKSLGFQKEGFSARYLKINGHWKDHERWAKVNPN